MGDKGRYQPALDGIRAVSIALVLVFHLGASWMPGGYLGVSVFFTLSGFLITSLLLAERASSGRVDIRAFYVRRLRRLLPASLLCLAGIAVLASVGTVVVRSDLRTGVLAAVFQVANWEHLLGHHSYADLFLAPSPIDHFWSLAIEEQFYWLWPLVIAGLTALGVRRSRRFVPTVLTGAFVVAGIGAFATAQSLGGDAAYFASWARFAEILAGAALAALLANRRLPARASLLGAPCLVGIVVLAMVTPAGRGWAYDGGLPLFALLSAGLIAGVQTGPVARLLSREPVPWIGRVSYGLYLFHWPVFTILASASVIEKLSLTGALTIASYYLVERPIRTGRVLTTPVHYLQAATCAFALVAAGIAALVPSVHSSRASASPVVISATLAKSASSPAAAAVPAAEPAANDTRLDVAAVPVGVPATTTTAPAPHDVVALFGDSIADWLLRDAAPTFARTDVTLVDAAMEACDAAVDLPDARGRVGQILRPPADCKDWKTSYPPVVENASLPVDIAVLVIGNAPILDRHVNGRWVGPCDDMSWYTADVEARIAYLRTRVGDVVLAVPSWGGKKASFLSTDDHLARMGCIRAQLTAMVTRLSIDTVDLAEVLCPAGPDGTCSELRDNDGTHVDPPDAPFVLDWLLDSVLRTR
jgi:peptidoglycan/LPS O-acetylase OafA/YrhL